MSEVLQAGSLDPATEMLLVQLLDGARDSILAGDFSRIEEVVRGFKTFGSSVDDEESFLAAQCIIQKHAVFPLLLEDPYTHHAFSKPRGFAGDATLIDLFYGHRSGSEASSAAGRGLFEALMRLPSCDAVRYRRGYYASFIDSFAGRENPKVLALACGHLREALFSKAVSRNEIKLLGIDSDALSIEEVSRSLGSKGVTAKNASVVDFVRRRAWGETYDGIYAAGLFDYLNEKIGRKVVSTAFTALRPGGVVSVANFLPSIAERGYMDLVMDWRLIYRTEDDMAALAAEVPADQATIQTWLDPLNSVVYLEVKKLN